MHFHNISLVGGPGVLGLGTNRRAVRIMTAHEHWLICPMHLLWKYDRKPCDGPSCIRCSLAGKRPPQAWRYGRAIERGLRPARRPDLPQPPRPRGAPAAGDRGHGVPLVHLPYFLPDDWSTGIEDEEPETGERPYLAAAGRLVAMKGFQRLIPMMRYLPEVDLRIAGTGPYEAELRALAADLPNVHFEGLLGGACAGPALPRRAGPWSCRRSSPRRSATSSSRPSRWARRSSSTRGAAPSARPASLSGGGLGYRTDGELLLALRRMVHDEELRGELAARGFAPADRRMVRDGTYSQLL